jgi:eukaryotic-like serine/threonine-protein kinase
MKALEKDRTRRYETASGMAQDLERYLANEPVEAGPPSAAYKLKKYALKHRIGLVTALVSLAVLIVATAVSTVAAIQARRAAERERQARNVAQARLGEIEKANDLLESIFKDLDPRSEEKEGKPLRAILSARLDRAAAELDSHAIGDLLTVANLQSTLATTQFGLGEAKKAAALFAKALQSQEAILGPDHSAALATRTGLGPKQA